MMKKSFVSAGIAIALTCAASTAFATITLVSKNAPADIAVYCNNHQGLYNIPANGALNALPWGVVALMFQSTDMDCQFKLSSNQQQIGSAHMLIDVLSNNGNGSGTITNVQNDPAYTVSSDKSWGVPNQDMTITLTKK